MTVSRRRPGFGNGFVDDVRYAWRSMARHPSLFLVALITLALGVGVNTAVFSVFYGVVMRPLPYRDADRLVLIWAKLKTRESAQVSSSGELFQEIKLRQRTFAAIAGIWVTPPTTFSGDPPVQVKSAFVSPNFFDVLGVPVSVGRMFVPEDGGAPSMMFSDTFWRQHYGASSSLIGKSVDGGSTLVGVLPTEFRLHFAPEANVPGDVQVFQAWGPDFEQARNLIIRVVARLARDRTKADAQRDMDRIAREVRASYPEFADEQLGFVVTGMHDDAFRDVRPALTALFAGGVFVLLICCVNVTGVLLARANDRRKEMAFRLALGASRGRILRQLFTEAAVLGSAGGLVGATTAWLVFRVLVYIRPERLARIEEPQLMWSALVYTAGASLAATVLFALAPALSSFWIADSEALRVRGQGWLSRVQRRTARTLVAGEIAVGVVLVTGAVLAARTLFNVEAVRPGFQPERLLVFQLPGMTPQLQSEWAARFGAIPGVESAGAISHLPFDDTLPNWFSEYRVDGEQGGARFDVDNRAVTPGYFDTMKIRLVEGRQFTDRDRFGAPNVVIIDETLARSTWPGQSAVGKTLHAQHMTARGTPFEFVESIVVGVVEHVHTHSLTTIVRPQIYSPFAQNTRDSFPQTFVLRTSAPPLAVVPVVRAALREGNRNLAMDKVQPMTAYIDREIAPTGFTAALASIFGGLALLLAATGIYGFLNYQVSRRMPEIGTRMVVGASQSQVLRMIFREGVMLAMAGLLVGLIAARLASYGAAALLYGVSAGDPFSFGVATLLVPAATLLGCWYPALRAARANPAELIREG